jgi:hypothetical protein
VTLVDGLQRAIAGLTYSSESDRPFIVVRLDDPSPDRPLDAAYLRERLRVPADAAVELRTIDDVLARHTHRTDPYDVETQRVRPRYEALQALCERVLDGAVAVRVGRTEVQLWLLGRAPDGGLLGLRTVAIET